MPFAAVARRAMSVLALAFILALAAACLPEVQPAQAATAAQLVAQGQAEYQAARFAQAQATLRQALARQGLGPSQRADAQAWLGLAYLAQGYDNYARQAFAEARRLDPGYQPDPQEMSPKAIALWDQAGNPQEAAPAVPSGGYDVPGQAAAPERNEAPPPAETYPGTQPPPQAGPDEAAYQGGGFKEQAIVEDSRPPVSNLRLAEVQTARAVKAGRPQGVAAVFSPLDAPIYLWFSLHELESPQTLRAVWSYLDQPGEPILESRLEVSPGDRWGAFSCGPRPGQAWPAGRYRVEVFLGNLPLGAAFYSVR